eukprot:jgi/Bigna1/144456/aug1.87_g19164
MVRKSASAATLMAFIPTCFLMAYGAAPLHVSPGGLAAAIQGATAGATLELGAGTFTGSDCGITVAAENVTIHGRGNEVTIIECPGIALDLVANGTVISNLTVIRSANSDPGGGRVYGLISITGSRATFIGCAMRNGLARAAAPSSYIFGGAISILAAHPPFSFIFTGCEFSQNGIYGAGQGGAINIRLSGESKSPSLIQVVGTQFIDNFVNVNASSSDRGVGIGGAALSISATGSFSVQVRVVASQFMENRLLNIAPRNISVGAITSNDLISVAGGGAINIDTTIVDGVSRVRASGVSLSLFVTSSSFFGNTAATFNCVSTSATANGGAIAVLGGVHVSITDGTRFEDNVVNCVGNPSSQYTGLTEGGALFLQGAAPSIGGDPLAGSATLNVDSISFISNIATCTGTACGSTGGAVALDPILSAHFTNTTATGNVAACNGMACTASGGFVAVVNGPNGTDDTIGCFNTSLTVKTSALHRNHVLSWPPPVGWDRPCVPLLPNSSLCASSIEPIMGGAISVTNVGCSSTLNITAAETVFAKNIVAAKNASSRSSVAFGAAYAAFEGIGGGSDVRAGIITASFISCVFACNSVTSQTRNDLPLSKFVPSGSPNLTVAGGINLPLPIPWMTQPLQSIIFDGAGCAFSGPFPQQSRIRLHNVDEVSASIMVMPDCEAYVPHLVGTCDSTPTAQPSAASTPVPSPSPIGSPTTSHRSVDHDEQSHDVTFLVGLSIGVGVGGIAVLGICYYLFYRRYRYAPSRASLLRHGSSFTVRRHDPSLDVGASQSSEAHSGYSKL